MKSSLVLRLSFCRRAVQNTPLPGCVGPFRDDGAGCCRSQCSGSIPPSVCWFVRSVDPISRTFALNIRTAVCAYLPTVEDRTPDQDSMHLLDQMNVQLNSLLLTGPSHAHATTIAFKPAERVAKACLWTRYSAHRSAARTSADHDIMDIRPSVNYQRNGPIAAVASAKIW